MKNIYTKPEIDVRVFDIENIINVSSTTTLTYGGTTGKGDNESFSSIFN